jgi:hypothetical protein
MIKIVARFVAGSISLPMGERNRAFPLPGERKKNFPQRRKGAKESVTLLLRVVTSLLPFFFAPLRLCGKFSLSFIHSRFAYFPRIRKPGQL